MPSLSLPQFLLCLFINNRKWLHWFQLFPTLLLLLPKKVLSNNFKAWNLDIFWLERICGECTSTWHFRDHKMKILKKCFDLAVLRLFSKHESQKVFFGEWAWHEGAIKMLVVLKRKSKISEDFIFFRVFFRCGIKIIFYEKKGWLNVQVVNAKQFFTFPFPLRLHLSARNNMELLCAPFIKNFSIAEKI